MVKRSKVTTQGVTEDDFVRLGAAIMGREPGGSQEVFERRWTTIFGVHPAVVAEAWRLINVRPDEDDEMKGAQSAHILWALMYLKRAVREADNAKDAGCDEKTFRKWYKIFVRRIAYLDDQVVSIDCFLVHGGPSVESHVSTSLPTRLFLKIGRSATRATIAYCWWMGRISSVSALHVTCLAFIPTRERSRRVSAPFGTRSACAF
jgi:hypothetical protein